MKLTTNINPYEHVSVRLLLERFGAALLDVGEGRREDVKRLQHLVELTGLKISVGCRLFSTRDSVKDEVQVVVQVFRGIEWAATFVLNYWSVPRSGGLKILALPVPEEYHDFSP